MSRPQTAVKQPRWPRAVPIWAALFSAWWCAPRCTTNTGLDRARGQSGSEVVSNGGSGGTPGGALPGGETVPCPCSFPVTNENVAFAHDTRTTAMLRVTLRERELGALESSDAFSWCSSSRGPEPGCGRIQLRVEEVLGGGVMLEPGDEIEAETDGLLPCFVGIDDVPVGGQALAQVSWPPSDFPPCAAREQCLEECESEYEVCSAPGQGCSDLSQGDYCSRCTVDLEDICPPRSPLSDEHIRSRGSARLTVWEEQILFAATSQAELRVPASELSELSGDVAQCIMRFGDWSRLPGVPSNPGQ